MAALPKERVQRAPAFKYTGIDYLGPLQIKESGQQVKKWVALFTCFTSRALHLEVVDNCTTEALTQALLRFMGRRRTPAVILSDNATQFQKSRNVFKAIFGAQIPAHVIEDMTAFCSNEGIKWRFIPEGSPWVGGFYERLVGLVKSSLKKVLWRSTVDSATLVTLLVQIEGILNIRPLISPSSDPSDKPLCPAHFVGPSAQLAMPPSDDDPADPAFVPDPKAHRSLMRQWEFIERKLDQFWKTWQTEYLQQLRETHQIHHAKQHGSVCRSPVVGEICLVKEATPRSTWKLGAIENLHYGEDGEVCFVTLRLPSRNTTRRGVKDLVPLEADFGEDETEAASLDANIVDTRRFE